jgi:hypothetical protein
MDIPGYLLAPTVLLAESAIFSSGSPVAEYHRAYLLVVVCDTFSSVFCSVAPSASFALSLFSVGALFTVVSPLPVPSVGVLFLAFCVVLFSVGVTGTAQLEWLTGTEGRR